MQRMTWEEICGSDDLRGRWVAIDDCRFDESTGQALEGAAKMGVDAQLGGAVGCVSVDARRVKVEITWQDRWASSDPNEAVECGAGPDTGEKGRQVLRLTSFVGRH